MSLDVPSHLRVLLVHDDPIAGTLLGFMLAERCSVEIVADLEAALERVAENDFNAVVVNHNPPRHDGLQVLAALQQWAPKARRILITEYDAGLESHARTGLIQRCLCRPTKAAEILGCLT